MRKKHRPHMLSLRSGFRHPLSGASSTTACLALGALLLLSGCSLDPHAKRRMCEKDKPDATLIRESTLSSFVEECGLAHYPDMTGHVQLHYAPKRGDGTLPVSSRIPFAVSEEGGAHGRVWYFCMPIPVPVQAPQKGVIPPPTDSRQAVCRYAGSGVDRMEIVHDDQDAQKYDPRNW